MVRTNPIASSPNLFTSEIMASDSFNNITKLFLEWCNRIGIRISPKVALLDLRAEGRGRGLGKVFSFSNIRTSDYWLPWTISNDFAVATGDFQEDEIIFSIPHRAVLNVRNAIPALLSVNSCITFEALTDMPSWLVCFPSPCQFEKFYSSKLTAESHLLLL
jgi:N-lysine methyltransferase SETD6